MSAPRLIPYAGKPPRAGLSRRDAPPPFRTKYLHGENLFGLLPLTESLDWRSQDRALAMFRDEALDTRDIAWRLEATEAAVANGIADARERERAR